MRLLLSEFAEDKQTIVSEFPIEVHTGSYTPQAYYKRPA